jgi:hypothetical protein
MYGLKKYTVLFCAPDSLNLTEWTEERNKCKTLFYLSHSFFYIHCYSTADPIEAVAFANAASGVVAVAVVASFASFAAQESIHPVLERERLRGETALGDGPCQVQKRVGLVLEEDFRVGRKAGGELCVVVGILRDTKKRIHLPLPSGGGPIMLFPGTDMSPFFASMLF